MKEVKKSLKRLKEIKQCLKKQVHASRCENINECPRNHKRCNSRLNLETACAWDVAKNIEGFIALASLCISEKRYSPSLDAFLIEVSVVKRLVAYHSMELQSLGGDLYWAQDHIRFVTRRIQEEFGKEEK